MRKKRRKKQERVTTKVVPLTPGDWGRICGLQWTSATRILIAALFAGDGDTNASSACEGKWSRVMQANRMLVSHRLPFRIRGYRLPHAKVHYTYTIETLGLKMHTITKTV